MRRFVKMTMLVALVMMLMGSVLHAQNANISLVIEIVDNKCCEEANPNHFEVLINYIGATTPFIQGPIIAQEGFFHLPINLQLAQMLSANQVRISVRRSSVPNCAPLVQYYQIDSLSNMSTDTLAPFVFPFISTHCTSKEEDL